MCFSAPASFAAGGALAAGGIATLRIPMTKSELPLALFPIIFAAHQLSEGVLWLSLTGVIPATYQMGALYAFILIAFVLWPIFVPFAMYMIEKGKLRKRILVICQIIGLYVGITYLVSIIQSPVNAAIVSNSIAYQIYSPDRFLWLYLVAVSIPFLIARNKVLMLLGVAVMLSSALALYTACSTTFPSVWCFYAAVLSLIIYGYFRHKARAASKQKESRLQHAT